MNSRIELDEVLRGILDFNEPDGDGHTYFNPPSSVKIKYPAIIYTLRGIDTRFANNGSYHRAPSYELILIDRNPDTEYLTKILDIPYTRFDRFYRADNLNHWVFTIYNL